MLDPACSIMVAADVSGNLKNIGLRVLPEPQHSFVADRRESPMIGPSSVEVSNALAEGVSDNRFVVNIGCHDGKSFHDPCYPLYTRGYPGIAIDGRSIPAIHENLPNENVIKLMKTFVTPNNSRKILRGNNCPDQPHMIKIDVDGYDRDILVSILSCGIRPDFFQVEIQPEFPPPIVFSIIYHPRYTPGGYGGFYGCSISAVEVVARYFGYSPIMLDNTTRATHDMIFLRTDLVERSGISPIDTREAYQKEGCRVFHFSQVGINSRLWQKRSDYGQLLVEIFQACVFSSEARCGVVLPFELGLDHWQ